MLLARALGGGQAVVGVVEEFRQKFLVDRARRRDQAAVVEAERVRTGLSDHGVDQRVRRADVVGVEVPSAAAHRHVGDAAEVERRRRARLASEEQAVQEGDQRCPVAAGGDVADAHVRDDRRPGPLGDPGRLADLKGAEGVAAVDPVEHRLAVRHDEVDGATGVDRLGRGVGEGLPDQGVELAHLGQGRLRRRQGADEPGPQPGRVRRAAPAAHDPGQRAGVEAEVDDGGVDPVVRGARDHAENLHCFSCLVMTCHGCVGPACRAARLRAG